MMDDPKPKRKMDRVHRKAVEEIRDWRGAFRGHQFKCVPENAQVFEHTIVEMLEHIDTLLLVVERLTEKEK